MRWMNVFEAVKRSVTTRQAAEYFFEIGMHCLGCPHSRGESIEQACEVHDTDADALLAKLNAAIA